MACSLAWGHSFLKKKHWYPRHGCLSVPWSCPIKAMQEIFREENSTDISVALLIHVCCMHPGNNILKVIASCSRMKGKTGCELGLHCLYFARNARPRKVWDARFANLQGNFVWRRILPVSSIWSREVSKPRLRYRHLIWNKELQLMVNIENGCKPSFSSCAKA